MLKKLLNTSEGVVSERLQAVCREYSAHVHVKVRVADVLPIESSGISREEYGFALRAHFDFLVTDAEHTPLFAVEFDGPLHHSLEQQERDAIKDRLCAQFRLPILRCRAAHLYKKIDGWDLLSWLVDVWFMRDIAERMREKGELPDDVDVDPAFIVSAPGKSRRFPYCLGLDAQLQLERWLNEGRIVSHVPRVLYVGLDTDQVWRGFASLEVRPGIGVHSTISMRSQAFPVSLVDPIEGILYDDICSQAEAVLEGRQAGAGFAELDAAWLAVRHQTRMVSCLSSANIPERP